MGIKIKDLLPAGREVPVGTGKAELRGLTLDHITRLLDKHGDALSSLFESEGKDFTSVVANAPGLVADALAMALGAEGQEDDIRKLPGSNQVELLLALWEETIPDVKKLKELLSGAMAALPEESALVIGKTDLTEKSSESS